MAFAVLKAPTGCSPIQFGLSLAARGDELLIGSPYRYYAQREQENIPPPACVLFKKNGERWLSSQLLAASEPLAAAGFGRAVALGRSVAAVGAPGDEAGDAPVHEFAREAGQAFSLRFTLDAPGQTQNGEVFHEYGSALTCSGQSLFVGAPLEDGPFEGCGAVHIFEGGSLAGTLHGAQADENFGSSLAISGDLLVVGAPGTFSNERLSGAAAVFSRDAAGRWQEICRVEGNMPGEGFGSAVAIEGSRFVVGAPGREDLTPAIGGRAELFEIDGQHCVRLAAMAEAAGFASAVAFAGDRLAIGQPSFNDGKAAGVGRVGLYRVGQGGPARQGWLVARHAKPGAGLGSSVVLGPAYVATGAPGNLEDPRNSGFVIVADF